MRRETTGWEQRTWRKLWTRNFKKLLLRKMGWRKLKYCENKEFNRLTGKRISEIVIMLLVKKRNKKLLSFSLKRRSKHPMTSLTTSR
jgi:hypothetical protein